MTSRFSGIALFLFLCSFAVNAAAQTAPANPMAQTLRGAWTEAKGNIRRSADVMPEAKYGFKPVDTVRSFGAILAHVAGASYEFCAAAKNEQPPYAEDAFEKSAKTKAEIVKALDGAIAYCDEIYQSLDDAKAVEVTNGAFGGGKRPRMVALFGNTGHFVEHYGNLVTYLRINGLVPPSSAPQK